MNRSYCQTVCLNAYVIIYANKDAAAAVDYDDDDYYMIYFEYNSRRAHIYYLYIQISYINHDICARNSQFQRYI